MRHTEKAFVWIVELLRKYKIPFQISGGLAAKVYGSDRKLADIDIDIKSKNLKKIILEIKPYIVIGPGRYLDTNWDIKNLATLKYKNQYIDLSESPQKIYDSNKKKWVILHTKFTNSRNKSLFGLSVPVILKQELIAYKTKLNRKCDRYDVEHIK